MNIDQSLAGLSVEQRVGVKREMTRMLEMKQEMTSKEVAAFGVYDRFDPEHSLSARNLHPTSPSPLIPKEEPGPAEPRPTRLDWCVPGDTQPYWLLVYSDVDMGTAIYETEAEARKAFEHSTVNWNCRLFAPARREVEQPTVGEGEVKIPELTASTGNLSLDVANRLIEREAQLLESLQRERELREENERLKADAAAWEDQRFRSVCTYCGFVSNVIKDMDERREQIAAHIVACEKHPVGRMATLLAEEEARAEAALASLQAKRDEEPQILKLNTFLKRTSEILEEWYDQDVHWGISAKHGSGKIGLLAYVQAQNEYYAGCAARDSLSAPTAPDEGR